MNAKILLFGGLAIIATGFIMLGYWAEDLREDGPNASLSFAGFCIGIVGVVPASIGTIRWIEESNKQSKAN